MRVRGAPLITARPITLPRELHEAAGDLAQPLHAAHRDVAERDRGIDARLHLSRRTQCIAITLPPRPSATSAAFSDVEHHACRGPSELPGKVPIFSFDDLEWKPFEHLERDEVDLEHDDVLSPRSGSHPASGARRLCLGCEAGGGPPSTAAIGGGCGLDRAEHTATLVNP